MGFSKTHQMAVLLNKWLIEVQFQCWCGTKKSKAPLCVLSLWHTPICQLTLSRSPWMENGAPLLHCQGSACYVLAHFAPGCLWIDCYPSSTFYPAPPQKCILTKPSFSFRTVRGTPDDLSAETAHRVTTDDSSTYISCVVARHATSICQTPIASWRFNPRNTRWLLLLPCRLAIWQLEKWAHAEEYRQCHSSALPSTIPQQ